MQPTFFSLVFGSHSPRWSSKIIFFLFVFGGVLFCSGFALSIFGFQSCQSDKFSNCSMTFKVLGPSLAVIGLASLLMGRSRARLERRRRELEGDQTDPDSHFLCGESRQFIQYLIFGILFVTCGILISVLGVWIPGCNSVSQNVSGTDTTYKNCGFLSLQIMGPVIVLIGLCFFVAAHIKKKHNLNDTSDSDEGPETPTNEPFHITVGDAVIIFPPPPPPYFADTSSAPASHGGSPVPMSENPPSYSSIFTIRAHHDFHGSAHEHDNIYTISLPSQSTEVYSNAHFPSEPPPKYEEKDSTQPDPIQTSSPSSTSVPDASESNASQLEPQV